MPFTPNNKQNMVAYMAARADPDDYGKLTLFNLPRSRTVFGPTQVNAQILADPNVAKELTLFNQQGSTVTLGNLLTVPIGNSLLYVQPIFIQASQGAIPELRRVAAFLNNRLGYTATLDGSIAQVLGETPQTPGPGPPTATRSGSPRSSRSRPRRSARPRRHSTARTSAPTSGPSTGSAG
jgi:uncharacterized protein